MASVVVVVVIANSSSVKAITRLHQLKRGGCRYARTILYRSMWRPSNDSLVDHPPPPQQRHRRAKLRIFKSFGQRRRPRHRLRLHHRSSRLPLPNCSWASLAIRNPHSSSRAWKKSNRVQLSPKCCRVFADKRVFHANRVSLFWKLNLDQ